MNKTLALLGLCASFLIPCLAAALTTSMDMDYQGQSLYQKGLYSKAIGYYQQAINLDPNNAQAYQDMGNAYMKLNDQADALSAYQKSLQINPNNPTLKVMVDNMNNTPSTTVPDNTTNSLAQPQAQAPTTVVERGRPRPRRTYVPQNLDPNLAPIDQAKVWIKAELGYDWAQQGDLINSSNTINNGQLNYANITNPAATSYSGSALASNSGLGWGGELGFLVSPNFGIAIGSRYLQSSNYTANVQYANSPYNDQENLTLTPAVVPITLDLYFFLPDHEGRFFLSAGAGYYVGVVHVDQTTTYNNFLGYPTNQTAYNSDEWTGDLYSGNIGYQVGIGREFQVSPRFGIEIYGRAYYAQITNFQGTLYDGNSSGTFGLASSSSGPTVVDADYTSHISSANAERYATIDFTGFDVGASLNFYYF